MTHPLELIHPRNLKHLSNHLQGLLRSQLWAQVLVAMVLGFALGSVLSPDYGLLSSATAKVVAAWITLPGNLFLTVIQMIVIPLVLASVVRGIAASGSLEQLRSTGIRLLVYFLLSTTTAIVVGILWASTILPGQYISAEVFSLSDEVAETITDDIASESGIDAAEIPAALVSLLPANPVSAAVEMNMLQIVIFSIVFGLALVSLQPDRAKPILELFGSLQSVVMRVVSWVMYLAPYAVFGFMAELAMQTGLSSLFGIGVYVFTLLGGLLTMLLIYTFVVWSVGGVTPGRFLAAVRPLQLLAFSTNSSVAVLPYTMKTAEEKLGVRPSTAQFVAPIGATINMDGTALFHGVATLFLTQVYGLELGVGMLVALVATAIGASIGTPATPGVGIVILSVVLRSVGVPLEGVALIIGVDRVLELFRTAVNVTGDVTAAVVIDHFLPATPSYDEEVATQTALEKVQQAEQEDVLTGPAPRVDAAEPSWLQRFGRLAHRWFS